MFTVGDIDLERFNEVVGALVAPHVTDWSKVRRWRTHNNRVLIEMPVKTFRSGGYSPDSCDGTASPNAMAFQAAHDIAYDLGLKVKWEPCEKGWGSFYWENLN